MIYLQLQLQQPTPQHYLGDQDLVLLGVGVGAYKEAGAEAGAEAGLSLAGAELTKAAEKELTKAKAEEKTS